MIYGSVDARLLPTVPLAVRETGGVEVEVTAVIDTGFNGTLTLPPALIARLGLLWDSEEVLTLADNAERAFQRYKAVVVWDGTAREMLVNAVEGDVLLGTGVLEGYHLYLELVPGGAVRIEALP